MQLFFQRGQHFVINVFEIVRHQAHPTEAKSTQIIFVLYESIWSVEQRREKQMLS